MQPNVSEPIDCFIFDCDGVLLDTEPLHTEAANRILAQFTRTLPPKLKLSLLGQSSPHNAQIIVRELHLPITPEEYNAEVKVEEHALFKNCKLMKGAQEAIESVAVWPKAIATSAVAETFSIKAAGKEAFFSQFCVIIKGDQVSNAKPAPDIFLSAFAALKEKHPHLRRERCLVVEDSPAGLRGAIKAGMQVAWLLDPIYDPQWYDAFADLLHVPRFNSLPSLVRHFTPAGASPAPA